EQGCGRKKQPGSEQKADSYAPALLARPQDDAADGLFFFGSQSVGHGLPSQIWSRKSLVSVSEAFVRIRKIHVARMKFRRNAKNQPAAKPATSAHHAPERALPREVVAVKIL